MRRRPSTDLTRVCRAAGALALLVALGLTPRRAHAESPDGGTAVVTAPRAESPTPPPETTAPPLQAGAAGPLVPPGRADPAPTDALSDTQRESSAAALHSGDAAQGEGSTNLKYLLERIEVVGNKRTKVRMVKDFVSLEVGSSFNVGDPEIEALRYRLLGTGWYDKVELALKRGRRPGWAVLLIQVEERSTLVFQELSAGLGWSVKGVKASDGPSGEPERKPEPYLGLSVADTNFLGTGKTLGGEILVSPDQQGVAIGYNDPVVNSSRWGFRTRATFVNGQEYFGGDQDVQVSTDCSEDESERCEQNSRVAVVDYWRTSLSLGTARDVGSFTRLTLDWRGDFVNVPSWGLPQAAQERRGASGTPLDVHAIDFAIEPGNSFVSALSVGLTYDKRDSAILPSRGTLASFLGDLASPLIGSDYQFVRLQANVNHWFPLRWRHTIRLGVFAGGVFGDAPFFYKFFVTDMTDLMPSRILGLNLDHRPAPNLFGLLQCGRDYRDSDASCGTAIAQMRQEELAARLDAEYVWPLVRGRRKFLKGADAYFLLGLYALADPKDFQLAIPGYKGIARLPVDLTFDLGVRLDTQVGVFQVGLAKWFWAPVRQ